MCNKNSGIYAITNEANGKKYVGLSNNMPHRWTQHRRSLLDGKHYNRYLQRAFDKYGEENFSFEALEYCPEEQLTERERHWIEKLETEYADKGYNAAYAVALFDKYDKNRRVNKSKRKVYDFVRTDETKQKQRDSLAKYYSNELNRVKHSLSKSEINHAEIIAIKTLLKEDLSLNHKEISERLNVPLNTVAHISSLASHKYILKGYNHIVKHRVAIHTTRVDRGIIRMYRDGATYQAIGDAYNMHMRTAIRRVDAIRNKHDDRCRLNVLNRLLKKHNSLIITLHNMDYSILEISKKLKVNRGNVSKVIKGTAIESYTNVNEIRHKPNPFKYKERYEL